MTLLSPTPVNTPLMTSAERIDTSFDFRWDTPKDRDPAELSPTPRRDHQRLWSKPLPGGAAFELVTNTPSAYLHHKSEIGEFFLSSDSVLWLFGAHRRFAPRFSAVRRASALRASLFGYSARIGGFAASLFRYCSCSAVSEERAQRCAPNSEAHSAPASTGRELLDDRLTT